MTCCTLIFIYSYKTAGVFADEKCSGNLSDFGGTIAILFPFNLRTSAVDKYSSYCTYSPQ